MPGPNEPVTMVVMHELGSLRLCTMFMCRRSDAFPPNPRAVNTYPLVDGSSLADAAAFFRLIVRDVERELQSMPEGMRQAVMLAAVSTDGYEGMAARLNMKLGTFRSRLSRGRQRLRTKFTSFCRLKWRDVRTPEESPRGDARSAGERLSP